MPGDRTVRRAPGASFCCSKSGCLSAVSLFRSNHPRQLIFDAGLLKNCEVPKGVLRGPQFN
jgi:hypothetical protein